MKLEEMTVETEIINLGTHNCALGLQITLIMQIYTLNAIFS